MPEWLRLPGGAGSGQQAEGRLPCGWTPQPRGSEGPGYRPGSVYQDCRLLVSRVDRRFFQFEGGIHGTATYREGELRLEVFATPLDLIALEQCVTDPCQLGRYLYSFCHESDRF